MSALPPLIKLASFHGEDTAAQIRLYVDCVYECYLDTVAHAGLTFRGKRISCRFTPLTDGKGFSFWHIIQSGGHSENDRTFDEGRCCRIRWLSWVIQNAGKHPRIHVFRQSPRHGEITWALWLYEHDYVVILAERSDYYLLKTAFYPIYDGKRKELERDLRDYQAENG